MVVEDKGAVLHSSSTSLCPLNRYLELHHKQKPNARPVALDKIPYLDYPELKFNEHESTEMPFRYVRGQDGKPVMPEVRQIT